MAVAVFVTCVLAFLFSKPTSKSQKAFGRDMCQGSSCREMYDFTNSIIDPSVNPCEDFYRHVCKQWIKRNGDGPSSYIDEAVQKFRKAVYDDLTVVHDGQPPIGTIRNGIKEFYDSCRTFLSKDTSMTVLLRNIATSFDIHLVKWLRSIAISDVFYNMVEISLRLGIPTALNVTYRTSKRPNRSKTMPPKVHVDVGTTLSSIFGQRLDVNLQMYLRIVINTMDLSPAESEVDLEKLDVLFSKTLAGKHKGISVRRTFKTLPSSIKPDTWIAALNKLVANHTFTLESTVLVHRLPAVQERLKLISVLAPKNRNIYLLLLVLSHVLVHDFRHKYLQQGRPEYECLRLTSQYLAPHFHIYVAATFQPETAEDKVMSMMSKIHSNVQTELRSSGSASLQLKQTMRRFHIWSKTVKNYSAPLLQHLSGDFITNVAQVLEIDQALRTASEGAVTLPFSYWQYNGIIGYLPEHEKIVVTTVHLLPKLFDLSSGNQRFNYAALGTALGEGLVLSALGNTVVSRSNQLKGYNLQCYEELISRRIKDRSITGHHVQELLAVIIALKVSHDLSHERKHEKAEDDHDVIFFRRFCLTNCGTLSSQHRYLPGDLRCNIATAMMQQFRNAFKCGNTSLYTCKSSPQKTSSSGSPQLL
ncbi:uncharacterized protein LOC135401175 isoform X2 [Ornithodoros turicata]